MAALFLPISFLAGIFEFSPDGGSGFSGTDSDIL
jgi:hypothetical protein